MIELLLRSDVPLEGSHVTVVGRSLLVGLPVALLLQKRSATVTMCHSKTRDLQQKCRESDIIIVAVGSPNLIRQDWVKQGAVVIDVGINAVEDSHSKRGYKLCGDVDFNNVENQCSKITPVPGRKIPLFHSSSLRICRWCRADDGCCVDAKFVEGAAEATRFPIPSDQMRV